MAATLAVLAIGRNGLKTTTLAAAWWWTAAGTTAWTAAWIATVVTRSVGQGWADVLWYAVAVAMLCPPVAVLGARRPGSRAWTWFVVLPLLAALSLPAVTAGSLSVLQEPGQAFAAFRLEGPWAIGFGLVLLMGVGNYMGTRYTLPALAYAAALVLLVGPLVEGLARVFPDAANSRRGATICLGLSAGLALAIVRQRRLAGDRLEALWHDFRDLYGLVWTRRVMDRTNEVLAARKLPVRLEWPGLVWTGPPTERPAPAMAEARRHVEHTLRWLLKRFVDPDWIEARLRSSEKVTG